MNTMRDRRKDVREGRVDGRRERERAIWKGIKREQRKEEREAEEGDEGK